jgi:purine-binding chemotaxis protein CheW
MGQALDRTQNSKDGGEQYLTFILAGEEYGIDILRVQEIRGWSKPTPMPRAPTFLKGVINLRGNIVPIIDLRERFDLPAIEYGPSTVVIVISLNDHEAPDEDPHDVGIVVDAVSEVYTIDSKLIKDAPDMGPAEGQFVKGLATMEEKLVILLDIDLLISKSMIVSVTQHAASAGVPEAVEHD